MARKPNPLTAIQQDDALFASFAAKINRIRTDVLAKHGKVSHTTIAKYLRREPIEQTKEDYLIEAVNSWVEDNEQKDQERFQKVKELIGEPA